MYIKHALVLVALSMFSQIVKAEQGCPPGQIPHSGTSMGSCGPIPGYQQQPPEPSWYPNWQSIAGDTSKGILGTSKGYRTGDEATSAALKDCSQKGGNSCTTFITEGNGCVALVFGAENYFTRDGKTLKAAEENAISACSKNDGSCRVYFSQCALPIRAQ